MREINWEHLPGVIFVRSLGPGQPTGKTKYVSFLASTSAVAIDPWKVTNIIRKIIF